VFKYDYFFESAASAESRELYEAAGAFMFAKHLLPTGNSVITYAVYSAFPAHELVQSAPFATRDDALASAEAYVNEHNFDPPSWIPIEAYKKRKDVTCKRRRVRK
jgi:hypothetical protein